MKKLDQHALDNHGNEYEVALKNWCAGIVLSIEKTPGKWYLSTLMRHDGPIISIDNGQNWDCVNFRAVLNCALDHVFTLEV